MARAAGQENAAVVEMNKDFSTASLSPAELVQFVAAWQQGGIGGEVLFHNLKAGERLPEGMTFEGWERDIEEHGATAAFLGFGDEESEATSDEIN